MRAHYEDIQALGDYKDPTTSSELVTLVGHRWFWQAPPRTPSVLSPHVACVSPPSHTCWRPGKMGSTGPTTQDILLICGILDTDSTFCPAGFLLVDSLGAIHRHILSQDYFTDESLFVHSHVWPSDPSGNLNRC